MIRRLAAFGVRRKGLSDSATLLPVSGQSELASLQTGPFKYMIHGNLAELSQLPTFFGFFVLIFIVKPRVFIVAF
jgi:hypothetical protein